MQKIIEDKDLGVVVLRKYYRSRAYTIRLKQGKVSVSMPVCGTYRHALELLDLHREKILQTISKRSLPVSEPPDESALRKQAKAYLPDRTQVLASRFGFSYHSLKINKSKGRWGSCSAKKNINLSLYLMTLPSHLIDYVILHELCHTKEMNHGPRFWILMDEVTGNQSKVLRKELRSVVRNY